MNKSRIEIIFSTFVSSALIALSIFFILKLTDIYISYQYFYLSLLLFFGLLFCTTYIFRNLIYKEIQHNYKTKKWTVNTIIIGTGKNASKIESVMTKNALKNTLCGYVSVDKSNHFIQKENILGSFNQIDQIIQKNNIHEAIIALDDTDDYQLFDYINTLYKYDIEIRFTPRLYEILTGSARIGGIGVQPFVSLTDVHMPDWQIAVKRLNDFILSTIMLIVLLPVFIYFAIAIKIDSKGPVFYKQERIGRYGKPFNILKFRTMYQNSENGTPQLSSATDERVTRIGRTLRKYRIDELPQFMNILKGEMSIVGPRPERKYYIDQIIETAPYYCLLYKIRPGLTSWGPIKIGYSDTIEKMIERLNYDIIYMEDMTLLNDLRILILTVEILFKGKGV
jgi:exopolysaccharide biosynthesis polyprenyl glycosylphosphotransferase